MILNGQAARMASNAARRALSPGGIGSARSKCPIARREAQKTSRLLQNAIEYKAHYRISEPSTAKSTTVAVLSAEFGPHVRGASLHCRLLHTSPTLLSTENSKPSSKIEETVNRLKEKAEKTEGTEIPAEETSHTTEEKKAVIKDAEKETKVAETVASVKPEEKKTLPTESPSSTTVAASEAEKQAEVALPAKKSLWVRFKNEVKHYVSGFKLLYLDVKVSSKIIWKVLNGKTLSRRENRQLVRTVSDLFRLVPFSVFVIVPFMEFLLPVALKLFPGMLPSTFTTSSERDAKMRRTLKAKLEYAKFLQTTLDEMAPTSKGSRTSKSAQDFAEFYTSVKELKVRPTNEDIVKFSKLFEDEITLDNMTRQQLVALCRLLELTPLGTVNFLRLQLELKVRQLKTDDRVIQREGLDNLNVQELQVACKERGMRAIGMSETAMKTQLSHWLDLSLNANIPTSLLLLSRTLYLPENLPPEEQIAATISALPESAAKKTTATIGEREGKIRNVVQLEVIKEEQRKIEEEEKEETAKVEAKKAAEDVASAILKEAAAEAPEVVPTSPPAMPVVDEIAGGIPKLVADAQIVEKVKKPPKVKEEQAEEEEEVMVDRAPVLEDTAKELEAPPTAKEEQAISTEDLGDLKSAIESLEKTSKTDSEEVERLKVELQDYEEDLQELTEIKTKAKRMDLAESKGATRLFSKVNRMLGKVDVLVDNLRDQEKALEESLRERESAAADEDEAKLVTVHELVEAVERLQKTPDESKLEQITEVLSRMDEDSDGVIKVDHVVKVIELLGREHVKLSAKQINQIIDMLQKEDMLETEKLIEKKLKTEGGDGGETADVIFEGSPSPVTDKVDDGGDSKSATKVASKE